MTPLAVVSWLFAYLVVAAAVRRPVAALRRRLADAETAALLAAAVAVGAAGYWLGLSVLAWPALLAAAGVVAVCVAATAATEAEYGWERYGRRALVGAALVAVLAGAQGPWPDTRAAHFFLRLETGYVVTWLLAFLGLGALALPAAAALFDRFEDGGAGVAIPFALAALGVVGYWVGHVSFGPVALGAGLGVLALGSALALRRGVAVDWRAYAEVATVFAVAFGLLVALRAVNPGVVPGGGEKFLDFGLLQSLLRADALPPEDMWFAGEPVRYYYGGHMLAALLTELTGTPARYAYNLALAGAYGTLAAAAYGLARAVAAERGRAKRTAGAAAAVLVAFASNLSTPLRLLVWALPGAAGDAVASVASLEVDQRPSVAAGPDGFNYWTASRTIDWQVVDGEQWHYIDEFPVFAFRNGDLHAHMTSTPFLLLTAAVLFQYWLTPSASRHRRRALVLLAVPALGGLIAVVNTWSLPTVAGVTFLALTFAPAAPGTLLPRRVDAALDGVRERSRLHAEAVRTSTALGAAAAVATLSVLFALPFFTGTASGRGVGLLPENRSDAAGLLLVHGAFLAVSVAFLLARPGVTDRIRRLLALVVAVSLLLALPYEMAAVALFVPVLLVAWFLLRTGDDAGYETALLVGALGLVTMVEFVYVEEQAGPGRMNTLFKVYMQVWVLWGTAAGAMLADRTRFPEAARALVARAEAGVERVERALGVGGDGGDRDPVGGRSPDGGRRTAEVSFRGATATLLAVALLASLSLYGGFVGATQFEGGTADPTLNGTAYVADYHQKEAAAIAWLNEREGRPRIVSAPGESVYRWVNAPSSLTGLPTVAGWVHEVGYRGEEPYRQRIDDVETIYTGSTEERAALLREYGVAYVYMGPEERQRYGTRDLADDPGISVEKEYGFVTIYRVNRSELR